MIDYRYLYDESIRYSEENMKVVCRWVQREFGFDSEVTVVGLGIQFDSTWCCSVNGFIVTVPEPTLIQMVEGIEVIRFIVDELHRFRIHPCPRESVLLPEVIGDVE